MTNRLLLTLLVLGSSLLACLPIQAQHIMSFKEYQALTHEEPYIYELNLNPGALLYFGSRHSFDPNDQQMNTIEEHWNNFQPDVAFTEGGGLSIDSKSREQAIKQYGEFGITAILAHRDGTPVHSLDPTRESEVIDLKEHGWSGEQIMLFYTLRKVSQSLDQQISIELAEVVPIYLKSLVERFDLQGPVSLEQFEASIERLLPEVEDWRSISRSYFYPGPREPNYFTNQISTTTSHFRDQYHVRVIKEAVLSGKRVFAISGSAHAVMQEPALRALLAH